MKFENPASIERTKAEQLLRNGSDDEIRETLVAIALNESELTWAQDQCIEASRHSDWSVRAVAATCFGHLARIHRELDLPRVRPLLEGLRKDPRTAEYAEAALDDIATYIK